MTRTRVAVLGGILLLASITLFALAWDATDPATEGRAPPRVTPDPPPEEPTPGVSVAPAGTCDVSVEPGQSIQETLDEGPPGRTMCIRAGTHRLTEPLRPQSGTRIVGEPGARLNGSTVVQRWERTEGLWVAAGQHTGPTIQCLSGKTCDEVLRQEAIYGDDVFLNGVPLERVLSKDELGVRVIRPADGRFFFDYEANQIWLNIRPTGRLVEVAVAGGLIAGSSEIEDVTVEGLVLEKSAGFGISSENGTGWTVVNNEVRLNHTIGIRMWAEVRILGNHVHHNGQYGVAASDGPDIVVEGNSIHHNNLAGYRISADEYWDAGGSKFVRTAGLVVRGNEVHHNEGDGVWLDIENVGAVIEGNRISENSRFGVFYEISGQGTVSGNTIVGNGQDAVRITSSSEVQVTGNTIEVSPDDHAGGGIRLVQDDREGEGFVLRDVTVHGNTLTMCRGTSGAWSSFGGDAIFQDRNVRFDANTYRVPSAESQAWDWLNELHTWSEWRSFGMDESGHVEEGPC